MLSRPQFVDMLYGMPVMNCYSLLVFFFGQFILSKLGLRRYLLSKCTITNTGNPSNKYRQNNIYSVLTNVAPSVLLKLFLSAFTTLAYTKITTGEMSSLQYRKAFAPTNDLCFSIRLNMGNKTGEGGRRETDESVFYLLTASF